MKLASVSDHIEEILKFRGIDRANRDGAFAACENVRVCSAGEIESLLAAANVDIMAGSLLPQEGVYTTYADCDDNYETYMQSSEMFLRIAPKRVLKERGNTAVMRMMIGRTSKYGKNEHGYRHILGAYQYDGRLYILYDAVYRIIDQRFNNTITKIDGWLISIYENEKSGVCNLYQLWLDEIQPSGQISSILLDAVEEQKNNISNSIARDMTVKTADGYRHITDDFTPVISGAMLYYDRTYAQYYDTLHDVSLPDASFTARTVVSCRDHRYTYRLILPDMLFVTVDDEGCTLTSLGEDLPPFTHAVQHFGRLFGIVGDRLYASRVGDFTDFTPPSDPSADPDGPYFTTAVGGDGDFTAVCSFDGKLIAFTKNRMLTTVGQSLPFTWRQIAAVGCADAAAVCTQAKEICFVSADGVYLWSGGKVAVISGALGLAEYTGATLSFVGDLLVLCKGTRLYFYDTKSGLWSLRTVENGTRLCGGEGGAALCTDAGGTKVCRLFSADGDFSFSLRTNSWKRRRILSVSVRAAISPTASLSLAAADGSAVYEFHGDGEMQTYTARLRHHYATSDILRFLGHGKVKIYNVALHTQTLGRGRRNI